MVKDLLASNVVPTRLRDALRSCDNLVENWNELTSDCTNNMCKVTSQRIRQEYLSETSPIMSLASDGLLREQFILSLIQDADREVFARNARRFQSSTVYAIQCANLAQFDPVLPTFAKGEYVPKGLTDERGNLLGTNLENAREFALDARDALIVVCSFICAGAPESTSSGRSGQAVMSVSSSSPLAALVELSVDSDAVERAARSTSAPSWEEIGALLPDAELSLERIRASGRGPTDVAANLRLFDAAEGEPPRVTLWRDQSAWCPYCHKVILQLEEKRVPYAVRRSPMKCYAGGGLQKPTEFLELNKAGTLPAALIDGEPYLDSGSILAAIESKFPEHPSLMPRSEAAQRAYETASTLEQSFSNAWLVWLTTPPWLPGDAQRAKDFTDSLDAIEAHLQSMSSGGGDNGPYLLGATFSLADVKLAPFMERAAASIPFYRGLPVRTGGRWPSLERWFEAMEARPVYAALRSDHYTHCLDLPPQLSPFGLVRGRGDKALRYAAETDGSDGVAWALPLPRGEGRLEPLAVATDDHEARVAAAAALWRNHEQVATFACRGAGVRSAVRLPPLTAAAIVGVLALAISGAAHGSASQAFQWAATALVMYDILGTRAPLADPRALPAYTLVPLVDVSLRLTAAALIAEGDDAMRVREAQRQLGSLDVAAAAPLRLALLYLRARVGVPRDMSYPAARMLRAHLSACIESLPSDDTSED